MCRNARIWSSHSQVLARPALGDKDKLCSSISKEAWGNKCSKVARVKSRSCCRLKHILQIWGLLGSKFEGVLRRPDSEASPRAAVISRFLSNWHCMFYPVACRPGSEPPSPAGGMTRRSSTPAGPPPGLPVPDAVWTRRWAHRAYRVEQIMQRPQLQYLLSIDFCPAPPRTDFCNGQNAWQWEYIQWRDDAMDLAVRLGYRE